MDAAAAVRFLNQNIHLQRGAFRLRILLLCTGLALAASGVLASFLYSASLGAEHLKWLLALGSTAFGSMFTFPAKDLSAIREKATALAFLRERYEQLARAGTQPPEELARLEQVVWQLIDKSLAR